MGLENKFSLPCCQILPNKNIPLKSPINPEEGERLNLKTAILYTLRTQWDLLFNKLVSNSAMSGPCFLRQNCIMDFFGIPKATFDHLFQYFMKENRCTHLTLSEVVIIKTK